MQLILILGKDSMSSMSKKARIDDTALLEFLKGCECEVFPTLRDGNCFLRSIAFELLGTKDDHITIRDTVVSLINLNQQLFTAYFMPQANADTMKEHLEAMSKPSTWATQLEVKATATAFQEPVYYCTKNDVKKCYEWNVIQPI